MKDLTLIDKFIATKSERTGKMYKSDLIRFLDWLTFDKGFTGHYLFAHDMSDYIREYFNMLSLKYVVATVYRHRSSLLGFYNYLQKNHHTVYAFPKDIKLSKILPNIFHVISQTDILHLCCEPSLSKHLGQRDRAILSLICFAGLKAEEVSKLKLKDWDNIKGTLKVGCRFVDILQVRIHHLAIINTTAYYDMRLRMIDCRRTSPLFINKHGNKISTRSLRRNLDKYLKAAGLDPRITLTDLRWNFIARCLKNKWEINSIMKFIGLIPDCQNRQRVLQVIKATQEKS